MKKLVLSLAVVFALGMVACTTTTDHKDADKTTEEQCDSTKAEEPKAEETTEAAPAEEGLNEEQKEEINKAVEEGAAATEKAIEEGK